MDLVKGLGADEMVDYTVYDPVEGFLAEAFGGRKFDLIIDARGIQTLHTHSPAYLAARKLYMQLGTMPALKSRSVPEIRSLISSLLQNYLRPRMLGGTPSTFVILSAVPDFANL